VLLVVACGFIRMPLEVLPAHRDDLRRRLALNKVDLVNSRYVSLMSAQPRVDQANVARLFIVQKLLGGPQFSNQQVNGCSQGHHMQRNESEALALAIERSAFEVALRDLKGKGEGPMQKPLADCS
jgi:hypothetical protein